MSKNWTGNKKSTFSTLGASNHSDYERADNDYYATDPRAIDPLLVKMVEHKEKIAKNIWENAAGEEHLSNRLTQLGFNVFSSDIIKRTNNIHQLDFLKYKDDGDRKSVV